MTEVECEKRVRATIDVLDQLPLNDALTVLGATINLILAVSLPDDRDTRITLTRAFCEDLQTWEARQ